MRTRGLTKRFGDHVAVDGVDLEVPRGAVYGFLGPNGSGKTTSIRMLLGLVRATSGEVELLGARVPDAAARVLPRVGALVEGPGFHPHLTGTANLAPARRRRPGGRAPDLPRARRDGPRTGRARRRGRQALPPVLARDEAAPRPSPRPSSGPRDVLVLDEPTNGLDPQGTREIRSLIGGLAAEGVTVLVSSHLLAEVEQVCTHLGVMNAGHLVAQGSVADLRAGQRATVEVTTTAPADAARVLAGLHLGDVGVTAHGAHGTPGAEHEPSGRRRGASSAPGCRWPASR